MFQTIGVSVGVYVFLGLCTALVCVPSRKGPLGTGLATDEVMGVTLLWPAFWVRGLFRAVAVLVLVFVYALGAGWDLLRYG